MWRHRCTGGICGGFNHKDGDEQFGISSGSTKPEARRGDVHAALSRVAAPLRNANLPIVWFQVANQEIGVPWPLSSSPFAQRDKPFLAPRRRLEECTALWRLRSWLLSFHSDRLTFAMTPESEQGNGAADQRERGTGFGNDVKHDVVAAVA
jgi:hypothetical protein